MDEDKRLKNDRKISSVKAAVSSFQDKFVEGKPAIKKFQANHPELKYSKARELHQAKKETDHFQQTRKLAESATAEAESSLSEAKNTVKDLTRRIEEANSRTKSQIRNLENLSMSKHREHEKTTGHENSPVEKVMMELESMKRELSKVKLDMASILEEKKRAEREADSSRTKVVSYTGSIEKLNKEIEEVNEENVLVELARIEAVREYEEIESKRREEAEKHSAEIEEIRKKNLSMVGEIEDAKEVEDKLAITLSDINVLESELKQVGEYEKGLESDEGTVVRNEDVSKLESVIRESETVKKELELVKDESFQFMTSMDTIRNELLHIVGETAMYKKKEVKTEMTIQNLNTKLLRAKSKLESASASADKAKLIVSNLTTSFEQLQSEAESAEREHSQIVEEAARIKEHVKETETSIDLAEERLEAALQELKAVKSSEAAALEKLKALIENVVNKRSLLSSKITISKFEYDYLKGHASEAIEIADKKVEASHAWVEALKASEREILIKTDLLRRQSRELKAEKEADGGGDQIQRNEGLVNSNAFIDAEDDIEKWIRQKMEPENENAYRSNKAIINRSAKAASATSGKRGKARRFSSPVIHGTPRSGSFTVRMRKR